MRDPSKVVDEMVYMYERFGSNVFSFVDLAFPFVRQQAIGLCNEIIRRALQKTFKWLSECRVRPLDDELLILMKKAGCVRVCFGIESGNNTILKSLKKNFVKADVVHAIKMAKNAGLEVDGMFMIGLPQETEQTIRETIDFAVSLRLRYAIFNIFVPYPGCELYDKLTAQGRINFNSWSDFISYPTYAGGVPVYVPGDLSKEKLMKLQSEAMKRFYLRPEFIINEFRNLKLNKTFHYLEGLKGLLRHN